MLKMFPNLPIKISSASFILLALLLLLLPLPWIIAAILAGIFHEFCHWAAVCLCGGRISRLQLTANGAVMDTCPMSQGKQLICVLAGPLGGLFLLLFLRQIPRIAIIAAFQSAYNLLPLSPLDGARALRCCAELVFPKRADSICCWVEKSCLFILYILAFCAATFLRLGFFPILLALLLTLKVRSSRK